MNPAPGEHRVSHVEDRRKSPSHDRRNADHHPLNLLLTRVGEDVTALGHDVKAFAKKLDEQRHDEALALAEAVAALMIKSFPEGDADGHRKAHEAQMRAIEARAEFWKKMLFEISKWGALGVLGWLCVRVWVAFLAGPTK